MENDNNNLHNRYLKTSTNGITVLKLTEEYFNQDSLSLVQRLIISYNDKLKKNFNKHENFDGLQTLLICEYQLLEKFQNKIEIKDNKERYNIVPFLIEALLSDVDHQDDKTRITIIDIIILQLAIHSDSQEILQILSYFFDLADKKNSSLDQLIEITKCITDSLSLNLNIHGDSNYSKENRKLIGNLIVEKISCWFFKIEFKDFRNFISLVSKTIVTFDSISVISSLWKLILSHPDVNESLTLFCTLADDFLFPKSPEIIKINIDNFNDERFWSIVKFGLTSSVQQLRKQAQYVMKTVINFINNQQTIKVDFVNEIIPFTNIANKSISSELLINFFLLLETLEEKQSHLVLPAFSRLDALILSSHLFEPTWLRIIFQRIFVHDSSSVVKSGLIIMLQVDPSIFNDEFINLLVQVVNNTFLYDEQSFDHQSKVTKALTNLFIKAEAKNINLINDFIVAVSRIPFLAPVPIFWIFEALRGLENIPIQCNHWTQRELEALTIIVDEALAKQKKEIREITLSALAKCFSIFATQTFDLEFLSKTFISNDYYHEKANRNNEFLEYVEKHIPEKNAVEYLTNNCENLIVNDDKFNINSFAKIIYLLWRVKKIFITKSCTSKYALTSLFDVLIGIDVRAYANVKTCEKALELIGYLSDNFYVEMKNLFASNTRNYFDAGLKFIIKSLENSMCPKSHDDVVVYMKRIDKLFDNGSFDNLTDGIAKLHVKSIETLGISDVKDIQFWYAAGVLYQSGKSIDVRKKYFDDKYADFILKICQRSLSSEKINKDFVRYISEYHGIMAKLMSQLFLQYKFETEAKINECLDLLMNFFETGSNDVIPSIPEILLAIIKHEKLMNDNNRLNVKSIVKLIWRRVFSMKRTKLFWLSIEKILLLITSDEFDEIDALEYVKDILEMSENIQKLRVLLLTAIGNLKPESKYKFYDAILSCFLSTNIGKVDKRIERQIFRYACNKFTNVLPPPDMLVHFNAIEEILLITFWNPEAVNHLFIPVLLSQFVKRKKGYYANSNIHILNNRIMQILLILQPTLDEENTVIIHEAICESLLEESNQPSVRVMQEWLLIRIHLANKKLRDQFWDLFARGRDSRPGSITSIASIVYHVSKHLPLDEKKIYLENAVVHILPNCMIQQFVVRLYCQVILLKLLEMAQEDETWELNFECKAVKDSLEISLRQGNLMKNSLKLLDDFYFSTFDPIKDYDFQTIFYDMPRLLSVSMDECINQTIIKSSSWNETIKLPFSNRKMLASIETPSKWHEKSYELNADDSSITNDIQKKIIPIKSVDLIDDCSSTISTFKQQILTNDTGMIVIASLIDSFSNLGGLARTSEIFCARELILGSTKYTENKEFQSLSVSSEKWITIDEVKPHKLRDYLMEKKENGWSLIGAEQTANSVNLQDIVFPKKTILLLGNEKNGIPANLIPLMDMCVEIPQAGIVRSLNVHVTGAICLWDYAKQHIFVNN